MKDEHVLSDQAFNQINSELHQGNYWIAYNTPSYFLDKHDLYFFNNQDAANYFGESNISEFDNYKVLKATCVEDVLNNYVIENNDMNYVQLLQKQFQTNQFHLLKKQTL
jgi:hypothetical protein